MTPNFKTNGDTPHALAWRMAGYQKDSRYIEAMVRREYGRSPCAHDIARMIEARAAKKPVAVEVCANDNGDPFKPSSLVKAKAVQPAPPVRRHIAAPVAKDQPWPKWYRPPGYCRGRLLERVAKATGLTKAEITGAGRSTRFVEARCIIAKVLRDRGMSYPAIGRLLGGRDHTTAQNLCQRFDNYVGRYPHLCEIYNEVRD